MGARTAYAAPVWALVFAVFHFVWASGWYIVLDAEQARIAFAVRWKLISDRMPTRLPSGDVEPRRIKDLRSAFESRGARRVVFPHTRHRQVANSEELVKVLHSANAVFLPGGASTITTFGTPRDVTIDELRIEGTFPADEATAQFCRTLP